MNQCKHPDGCLRKVNSHGWCEMHHRRILSQGRPGPAVTLRDYTVDLERFITKTRRDPSTGCLLWTAGKTPGGYGAFHAGGRQWNAHRWIFYLIYDLLPEVVMHQCDNRLCVDWERCLRAGTHATNAQDRELKGRGRPAHPRKLTTEKVAAIREAYAGGGFRYKDLAQRYGVSPSMISLIVRRQNWT